MEETFDAEFKLYLSQNGIIIDDSIFNLKMNPPQNFAAYRLSELDTARVQTFSAMQEVPYMSKRFAMKRFLGLSQEEIAENERLWREENRDAGGFGDSASAEMRNAGITPGGIQSDLEAGTPEAGAETGAEAPIPSAPEAGGVAPSGTPAPEPTA
jgi:hypothetical protein